MCHAVSFAWLKLFGGICCVVKPFVAGSLLVIVHILEDQHHTTFTIIQVLMLCLQIDPLEMESSLTLSGLSPYDNGRVIICSAENMVGQMEATLQLNILCKGSHFSVVIDCKC